MRGLERAGDKERKSFLVEVDPLDRVAVRVLGHGKGPPLVNEEAIGIIALGLIRIPLDQSELLSAGG